MKKSILLIGLVLVITGCNDSKKENSNQKEVKKEIKVKDEKYHTVKYFSDNPDITKKRIEECKNLTETSMAIEEDCSNAKKGLLEYYKKTEKFKTKKYYKEHVKERSEKISKCEKDFNYRKKHPQGCTNAMDAYAEEIAGVK